MGVVLFGETLSAMKLVGIVLVLMGITALKLA
jgi:quaternary ammonium compound-resistance protein SugE